MVYICPIGDYGELARTGLGGVQAGECEDTARAVVLIKVMAKAEKVGAEELTEACRVVTTNCGNLTVAVVKLREAVGQRECKP